MTIPTPEPIGAQVSHWGEGPLWHRDRLLYVDIEDHKILSFNPATQQEQWSERRAGGTRGARSADWLLRRRSWIA